MVIELAAGDLLFFPDSLIHHSNEPVSGERHSIVAFTQQNVFDYWKRKYEFKDKKVIVKVRRKRNRNPKVLLKNHLGKKQYFSIIQVRSQRHPVFFGQLLPDVVVEPLIENLEYSSFTRT